MKLILIKPEITRFTKITNYLMIGIFIALVISVSTWDFKKGNNDTAGTLLISYFGLGLVKLVRSFVIKDFKEIGTMFLGSENILIETDGNKITYEMSMVESINIHYYGYEGESYPISSNGIANIRQKKGDKNIIELLVNGELLSFEFFLKKYIDRNRLFKFISSYKKIGVNLNFTNKFGDDKIYRKL